MHTYIHMNTYIKVLITHANKMLKLNARLCVNIRLVM